MPQLIRKPKTAHSPTLETILMVEEAIKNAKEVIRHAVSGMLPKNKMRDERMKRLMIKN